MEVYYRLIERIRGALWAHHRRLMPERQFHRILGYVYNNKYEHQIRLDKMTVVGCEWGGRVEVCTTPSGHILRVRVNPSFQDLPVPQQKALLVSAYSIANKKGRSILEKTEMKIYNQFLRDIKPIVMGIRDNPEFYTVSDDTIELPGGTLKSSSSNNLKQHRTIPYAKAVRPQEIVADKNSAIQNYMANSTFWRSTPQYREYIRKLVPELRPRGSPGAKKTVLPLDYTAPYIAMDEQRLLQKNWFAFLDNKHVAEVAWTRSKIADREKLHRDMRKWGQIWHIPINSRAIHKY